MSDAPGATVVVGLGNPLMGDDGIGIAALERLRECCRFEPEVLMADGGTWGMNLLPLIEDADRILFLDAIDAGVEPGAPLTLERERLPRYVATKLSPHQIDLKEVLALAELRGTLPRYAVAVGLQPSVVEMSTELSEPVRARLDEMVDLAVGRLEEWGHRCRRRSTRSPSKTPGTGGPGWVPPSAGAAEPSLGGAPCTR